MELSVETSLRRFQLADNENHGVGIENIIGDAGLVLVTTWSTFRLGCRSPFSLPRDYRSPSLRVLFSPRVADDDEDNNSRLARHIKIWNPVFAAGVRAVPKHQAILVKQVK